MSGASRARRLLPKALLLALAALALAGVLLALFSGPAEAATTFTVNRTGDGKDRKINGVCDASRTRGQQCTLRAAIQEANATSGADTINFNIGSTSSVKTISPARPLPAITEAVMIDGYTQRGASENTLAEGNDAVLKVQLNGTNAGTGPEANGLTIEASDSTIKGLVINRFGSDGVELGGKGGNEIEGNFIGTNASGTTDLGNVSDGVRLNEVSNNTVGGMTAAARNVISGNEDNGVRILGSSATDNKVEGNFIGTKKNGTEALGNADDGVLVDKASNNTIGGTAAAARNAISGNENGVLVFAPEATDNKVEGNTISGNTRSGVIVFDDTGNRVLSNRIFSNGRLGIDLSAATDPENGVTANDTKDPDTGPNNLQNFPVITSVIQSSSFLNPTTISGTLNSTPSQTFTVQCFLAGESPEEADVSGHGEGKFFMAEDTTVTTNADGNGSFECNFLFSASLEGKRWSATATNEATGDTSEFSEVFAS